MSPETSRDPMVAHLLAELDRLPVRTGVVVAGMPESKFREIPPDGGWSVAQVFEHLCLVNERYLSGPLPEAATRARAAGTPRRPWRASLFGGWLTKAMREGGRAVSAPRSMQAGPVVRERVVEDFLASVTRLRALIVECEGSDLRTSLPSPILPIVRMNLGDGFLLMVTHAHRHLGQAERTRRAVGM